MAEGRAGSRPSSSDSVVKEHHSRTASLRCSFPDSCGMKQDECKINSKTGQDQSPFFFEEFRRKAFPSPQLTFRSLKRPFGGRNCFFLRLPFMQDQKRPCGNDRAELTFDRRTLEAGKSRQFRPKSLSVRAKDFFLEVKGLLAGADELFPVSKGPAAVPVSCSGRQRSLTTESMPPSGARRAYGGPVPPAAAPERASGSLPRRPRPSFSHGFGQSSNSQI